MKKLLYYRFLLAILLFSSSNLNAQQEPDNHPQALRSNISVSPPPAIAKPFPWKQNEIAGIGVSTADSHFVLLKSGSLQKWDGNEWTELIWFLSEPTGLLVDKHDNVWMITKNFGIHRYKDGKFSIWDHTTHPDELPSTEFSRIAEDKQNNKWFVGKDVMLQFDGNRFIRFDFSGAEVAATDITSIRFDNKNHLWISSTTNGIAYYNGIQWTKYNQQNSDLLSDNIQNIDIDKNNRIKITYLETDLTSYFKPSDREPGKH